MCTLQQLPVVPKAGWVVNLVLLGRNDPWATCTRSMPGAKLGVDLLSFRLRNRTTQVLSSPLE